jgi:hypothetical protein
MITHQRIIIFFIPPKKVINGGILSIFSVCASSRESYDIHKAKVVLCVYPGHKSYKKNDLFDNDEYLYSFDEIIKLMPKPEFMQVYVPEYASVEVFNQLIPYRKFLKSIPELNVNIMNQNILLMPEPAIAAWWFLLTPRVTQTTAHDKYSTQALADKYDLPCHHLSTYVDAKQYTNRKFEDKENIILLSPDKVRERDSIVKLLSGQLPNYRFITVENMKYEDYKDLISRARFTITFGEGFDGYFVEAFFTGGIAFAVYNDDFFPDKEFASFGNIYASYDEMLKNIVNDISYLDSKARYEKVVRNNLNKINELYSHTTYQKNLRDFYAKRYTYLPSKYSAEHLIASILRDKETLVQKLQTDWLLLSNTLSQKDKEFEQQEEKLIKEKDALIDQLINSVSWKVTEPLRRASSVAKRLTKS